MSSDMSGIPFSSRRCVAYLYMNTGQATNVSTGDHIKFDTVAVPPIDTRITVDVVSPYTSGAGSSIGRFSLSVGYLYEMEFSVGYADFSSAAGVLSAAFYDTVSGNFISPSNYFVGTTNANSVGMSSTVKAIYSPTSSNLIEVRLRNASSITNIGFNSGSSVLLPTLIIKTL